MKKILLAVLIFCSYWCSGQIYLSNPIAVSFDQSFGTRTPRVQLFEDGTPVIYWGKGGSAGTMYISVWRDTAFSLPIEVPTGSISPSIWGGALGPEIVTFENTLFLVFESYGNGVFCIKSEDKGLTFNDPVRVSNLAAGRVATLPDIGVDEVGNPFVSFVTTDEQEEAALYEIAFSKDGGDTFESSIVANDAASGDEVCECCPASVMTGKDSTMFLVFRNNDSDIRDIWATKSTDGGLSFTEAIDLDDTDWEIFGCPSNGPSAAVLGDTLFSAFYSLGEGKSKVYLSTMHIEDSVVDKQIDLPSFFGNDAPQNFPRLSGKNDTLGIVWQEQNGFGSDIVLGYSISGTDGLEYIQISDNQLSESNADVAFANGVFHIVYADQLEGKVFYRAAGFSPFSKTTQIADNQLIEIVPNPFSEQTLIDLSALSWKGKMNATLLNNHGQTIRNFQIESNRLYFEKEELNAGIYFLRIESKEGLIIKKLIII